MAPATRPTLLLLHGPGQGPTDWQPVVDHLDPDRPMFAPWLKGLKPHERQTQPGFSVPPAVEDLAGVMELRGIEQADLVGYSIGGLVALALAARYPARVAHLVLVSTPPIPAPDRLKMQRRLISMMPASQFPEATPKDLALRGVEALLALDAKVDFKAVTAPTLVVTGQSDPAAAETAAMYGKGLKAAVRRLAAGADLPAAAPAELARLVEDFCAGRPADPA
ncbi:MAG: alpha/beta fold hydrolase [Propionibacteriaceae bacterium]|jgi:pimeloyl-ACP methyl ester carboxylesterase|nr:alpha/beta fold hydrolase [Propionibacteriaceae bacterium]